MCVAGKKMYRVYEKTMPLGPRETDGNFVFRRRATSDRRRRAVSPLKRKKSTKSPRRVKRPASRPACPPGYTFRNDRCVDAHGRPPPARLLYAHRSPTVLRIR